jgi:hypothetical protein
VAAFKHAWGLDWKAESRKGSIMSGRLWKRKAEGQSILRRLPQTIGPLRSANSRRGMSAPRHFFAAERINFVSFRV